MQKSVNLVDLAKSFHTSIYYFFRAHRTNDLTKKLEKVGQFECDELEKHCRVSAKCYPTEVPALYTMAKEKFNAVFLVLLLLVSRQYQYYLVSKIGFDTAENEPLKVLL